MTLLGVRATASRLNVHENTIRNWALSGFISPAQRKPDGSYMKFSQAEIARVRARLREANGTARQDEPAGDVVVSVLVRIRQVPSGMSPDQVVREVASSVQFGKPEVTLHSVRRRRPRS